MLTSCSARAWQSLPSVPGRSSRRIVNSLLIRMLGTSFCRTSGKGWKVPARRKDVKILRQLEFDCKVRPRTRPGEVARVLRCGPQQRGDTLRASLPLVKHSRTTQQTDE